MGLPTRPPLSDYEVKVMDLNLCIIILAKFYETLGFGMHLKIHMIDGQMISKSSKFVQSMPH